MQIEYLTFVFHNYCIRSWAYFGCEIRRMVDSSAYHNIELLVVTFHFVTVSCDGKVTAVCCIIKRSVV